jgi:uncharacterized protein (TIGR02452 family)
MSLAVVATETLKILDSGVYVAPSGGEVSIEAALRAAVGGTRLYTPEALHTLLERQGAGGAAPAVEVTSESSQEAAHRLVKEGSAAVAMLNFASARAVGGGFLNGSRAQEEDICRCSGLFRCLQPQTAYYTVNRAEPTLVYTDHIIYSPAVPFFRVQSRSLLDTPFEAAVLTAPAPNTGAALRKNRSLMPTIDAAVRRRAGMVLAVAREHGHRILVLGAWGCGVFKTPPALVADAFGSWLEGEAFAGDFDRVVFPVFGSSDQARANLSAFRTRLAPV